MFLIVADNKWDVKEDSDVMTLRCTVCEEVLIYAIDNRLSKPEFDEQLRAHSSKHRIPQRQG